MAEYGTYYYGGSMGSYGGETPQPIERKYTIVQSLWTKPIKDKQRLKDTLYVAALSLAYAHRSGYKVHMHTDRQGMELLKNFGYEELLPTLDDIPNTVPTELFAAGKFFAMRAEGALGKIHIDLDVYIKKPHILDRFYENYKVDVICQQDEDFNHDLYDVKAKHMHIIGYPFGTRPSWTSSLNTGVVGFNNPVLASKYMSNYFEALRMYTKDKFEAYKAENNVPSCDMLFDFILEQATLSYMSIGYNVLTLVPTKDASEVADKIGYQHDWGASKWEHMSLIRANLQRVDRELYRIARLATYKVK